MWISGKDMSAPFESFSPSSRLSHSAGLSSLCYTVASHLLSTWHTVLCVFSALCLIVLPPPPHAVSTSLFSVSASLFLFCKQVHQYRFPRFHIHAFIFNISFSLSDLVHFFNRCWIHLPHYDWLRFFPFYGGGDGLVTKSCPTLATP